LSIPQPNLPDKVKIYKMVRPEITTEYLVSLGVKFGLKGEVQQDNDAASIQDKESGATLGISKITGTIDYKVSSKFYPKEKPNLPSDEEAKKIAMDFLSERSLLPEGDVASTVNRQATTSYGTAHLLVSFTHAIDITGPGAKHGVRIGNNGEVIAVFINPTNPLNLPVQEIATPKSINAAYQEMQVSQNYLMSLKTQKVKVTTVKIAYWLESVDKGQEYIVPVYVFGGQCFDNSGKQVGIFTGYAQAVD